MAYEQDGADDSVLIDGDTEFIGLDARLQPERLAPGMLQVAQNVRLNQGTGLSRLGLAKQTNSISFNTSLLFIPFTVGSTAVIVDQATDGIFGATLFSDPNNANLEWAFMVSGSKAFMYSPGQAVVSIAYPSGELCEPTDSVDLYQAAGFIYMVRGYQDVNVAVSGITSSSTTATVTTVEPHGYTSGQYVVISGATLPNYNGQFQITVTGGSTFTYTMGGSAISPAVGPFVLYRTKQILKWDGNQAHAFVALPIGFVGSGTDLIYTPPANSAMLQVNRAFLVSARNVVQVTNIDNVEQSDSIYGDFTVAPGWSDYLVGCFPYQDNYTLLFLRRSIYLLANVNGDVAAVTSQILTQQVGCISRRSIATCGANVLFLSDMGVFMLQPGYELALRGNWEPLSAPIESIIQSINFSAIQSACASYWNNRYYLAIPINGSARNNCIIVYNFLNQKWESQDTFPNGFLCDFFVLMNLNNFATLYLISREGGVYGYEQNEMDDFAPAAQPAMQYQIDTVVRTRRYIFGTNDPKRFIRLVSNLALNANTSVDVTANTINPEQTRSYTVASVPAVTSTVPAFISRRGYGLEIQMEATEGRFQLTNVSVSAVQTGRKSMTVS